MRHPEDRRRLIAILASMQPVDASAPWESSDLHALSPADLRVLRIDPRFLDRLAAEAPGAYQGLQTSSSGETFSFQHVFSRCALEQATGLTQEQARDATRSLSR
jgi:hypothetical protein